MKTIQEAKHWSNSKQAIYQRVRRLTDDEFADRRNATQRRYIARKKQLAIKAKKRFFESHSHPRMLTETVLKLLGDGLSVEQIAKQVGTSESHIANIKSAIDRSKLL